MAANQRSSATDQEVVIDPRWKGACTVPGVEYMKCTNMKPAYEGWDGERYRCEVCGQSYFLDYEEMK